jgi:hypothetical protein
MRRTAVFSWLTVRRRRPDVRTRVSTTLAAGGMVLVMAGDATCDAVAISEWLPAPVTFTTRTATALERGDADHPWAATFGLAELYFAEEEPPDARVVMRRGIAGPFTNGASVVLTASRTDWSLFNRRPEEEKVGAVACYERLVKPSGAALVARKVGNGTVAVCTLDTASRHVRAPRILAQALHEHGGKRAVRRAGWRARTEGCARSVA